MVATRYLLCLPIAALALGACGGEDDGRPDFVLWDGTPGPNEEDLGSGPYRCDADDGLEFLWVEDFESGAAGGSWYTNNDVCEICQGLIDLRVGSYDRGASLERLENAVEEGTEDDVRRELVRIRDELGRRLYEPKETYLFPTYREVKEEIERLLATGLDEEDLGDVATLVQETKEWLREQLPKCREMCAVTQTPLPVFAKPVPATEIPGGGRCGSRFAVNVKAGPLTDWGGTIGWRWADLDAGDWEGICFWARVGTGSGTAFRVELSERHSDEKFDEGDGPICNPDHTDDTDETGCDKFGTHFLLDNDWQFFAFPFDELRQKGWGKQAPYFDIWGLRGGAFQFERGAWDIWVDDVAIYRRREP